jgi:hypothetical protein
LGEPEWWKATARHKWKAWKDLGLMDQSEAKIAYIQLALHILKEYEKLTKLDIDELVSGNEQNRQSLILKGITVNIAEL